MDREKAVEEIQCEALGFCGCGSPDDNLALIRDGLALIAVKPPEDILRSMTEWPKWFKAHSERGNALFGNERSRYFFYYWCDKEELTEHGASVPGWLTVKGSDLLEKLNAAELGK